MHVWCIIAKIICQIIFLLMPNITSSAEEHTMVTYCHKMNFNKENNIVQLGVIITRVTQNQWSLNTKTIPCICNSVR